MQYPDEAPPGETDAGDAGRSRCSYWSYTCESDACLNERVKLHHETTSGISPSLAGSADEQQSPLEQPRDSDGVEYDPPGHPDQPPRRCDDRGVPVAGPPGRANQGRQPPPGAKSFRCRICGARFPRAARLAHHRRIHRDGAYKCEICNAGFPLAGNLAVHRRTHIGGAYKCKICNARFPRAATLALHRRRHVDGAYICEICGARSKRMRDYISHKQRHAGKKPHGCSFCPERFQWVASRDEHEIVCHTHQFPHWCERCGKGFVRAHRLRVHHSKCGAGT